MVQRLAVGRRLSIVSSPKVVAIDQENALSGWQLVITTVMANRPLLVKGFAKDRRPMTND